MRHFRKPIIEIIIIILGNCPTRLYCDFESDDICGYTYDQSGNFNWTRYRGSTSSYGTGPSYDHTTFTSEGTTIDLCMYSTYFSSTCFPLGYYMYIEASSPQKPGDTARLVSPVYPSSREYQCLQFYYHQYGTDIGALNVYKRDVGGSLIPTKMFTSVGNRFNEWHVMELNFVAPKSYNLIFEGIIGKSFEGDIAIDDVRVKERPCPQLGYCDFEQSLCSYKNAERNKEVDWIRVRGAPGDNTIGTYYGTYIAFEMLATTKPTDRAVLISADLDNTAQYCFRYSYRRFGDGRGTLNIYRETFPNTTARILLVKHQGDAFTTEWQVNQINLTALFNQTSNVYRLILEGTDASGVGRLMLDDLELSNEPCAPLPSNCSIRCNTTAGPHQCIPSSQVCDFNIDCLNGADESSCGYNCDFERNQCTYTDPSAGIYRWQRQRAGASTPGSGPLIDHTTLTGNGYYMIVSTNNGTIDDRAHLLSTVLQQSSSTCEITFYYHMSGVNVGLLEVLLIQGTERSRIWSIEGNRGDRWFKAVVKIGRLYKPFRVRFDARKTATALADITIDDIVWVGCNLPVITNETSQCTDKQFTCDRGGCVDLNRLCDYTDDCGDMSDESNKTCTRTTAVPG